MWKLFKLGKYWNFLLYSSFLFITKVSQKQLKSQIFALLINFWTFYFRIFQKTTIILVFYYILIELNEQLAKKLLYPSSFLHWLNLRCKKSPFNDCQGYFLGFCALSIVLMTFRCKQEEFLVGKWDLYKSCSFIIPFWPRIYAILVNQGVKIGQAGKFF